MDISRFHVTNNTGDFSMNKVNALALLLCLCGLCGSAAARQSEVLEIKDVVVAEDWSPETAEQVMLTLGVACPATDSAGFAAAGAFGETLTLDCLANNQAIGAQVRLSISKSVELANETVALTGPGNSATDTAELQLNMFSGNIWVPGSPPQRVNVLGYALTSTATVTIDGSNVTMTATTYHPIGVSISPALANAFILQMAALRHLALEQSPPSTHLLPAMPM
jgi:hypothetical protein